jgi:hypothetical protein
MKVKRALVALVALCMVAMGPGAAHAMFFQTPSNVAIIGGGPVRLVPVQRIVLVPVTRTVLIRTFRGLVPVNRVFLVPVTRTVLVAVR